MVALEMTFSVGEEGMTGSEEGSVTMSSVEKKVTIPWREGLETTSSSVARGWTPSMEGQGMTLVVESLPRAVRRSILLSPAVRSLHQSRHHRLHLHRQRMILLQGMEDRRAMAKVPEEEPVAEPTGMEVEVIMEMGVVMEVGVAVEVVGEVVVVRLPQGGVRGVVVPMGGQAMLRAVTPPPEERTVLLLKKEEYSLRRSSLS
jgi:hypothetical protein